MSVTLTKNAVLVAISAALIFLGSPRSAQAYLDPASGSIILQILVAAVAAAAVTIKAFWGRIRMLFSKRPAVREDSAEDE